MIWCRVEVFERKNVTLVLPGERIVCVRYVAYERRKEEGDIHNGR